MLRRILRIVVPGLMSLAMLAGTARAQMGGHMGGGMGSGMGHDPMQHMQEMMMRHMQGAMHQAHQMSQCSQQQMQEHHGRMMQDCMMQRMQDGRTTCPMPDVMPEGTRSGQPAADPPPSGGQRSRP